MFENQPRQSKREIVTGESHYLFGKRYRLEVIERRGRHEVVMKSKTKLILFVQPGTTTSNRQRVLNEWYRSELKKLMPELIAKWEPIIGKKINEWSGAPNSHATTEKQFVGTVENYYTNLGVAQVKLNAGSVASDKAFLITGVTTGVVKGKFGELRTDSGVCEKVPKGEIVSFKVPEKVRQNDKLFVLVKR